MSVTDVGIKLNTNLIREIGIGALSIREPIDNLNVRRALVL
jgi:hypothetical protein